MIFEVMEERLSDTCAVLQPRGRLNAVTAPEFKAQLKRLVEGGYVQLIVDMADVPFVDSSGLAALVSGLKATRQAGGTLRLTGLSEDVRTVFELTLLERVFELYLDKAAALSALSQERGEGV